MPRRKKNDEKAAALSPKLLISTVLATLYDGLSLHKTQAGQTLLAAYGGRACVACDPDSKLPEYDVRAALAMAHLLVRGYTPYWVDDPAVAANLAGLPPLAMPDDDLAPYVAAVTAVYEQARDHATPHVRRQVAAVENTDAWFNGELFLVGEQLASAAICHKPLEQIVQPLSRIWLYGTCTRWVSATADVYVDNVTRQDAKLAKSAATVVAAAVLYIEEKQ